MKKYYLGLDIGTNSVGWAVTDEKYNICKFNGKSMWGIRLFDGAETAAERRVKRSTRRRLQRQRERIDLLQELFADEIAKVDETFFLRLNESRLNVLDKSLKEKHPLFINNDYSEKEYYKQYPTIFHLRKELVENKEKHDIRLVYLAIHNILKNRGHFLIDGDIGNAKSFNFVFDQLINTIKDELGFEIIVENIDEFESILRNKEISKSEKAKKLSGLLNFEKDEIEEVKIKKIKAVIDNICKLIVGNKADITKIFEEDIIGLEKNSFSFSDSAYDEAIRPNLEDCMAERCFVIDRIKALYDWSILVHVLDGEEFLSFAKVKSYNCHCDDLKKLKRLINKYCTKEEYKKFFSDIDEKVSYTAYIGSTKINNKKVSVEKKCSEEDFYKKLKELLNKMEVFEEDEEVYRYVYNKVELKTILPLQRNKDNGTIPNQVHKIELEKILENASVYFDFLNKKDREGFTVSQKILSLFSFRIPYYVGPLSDRHKLQGSNAWAIRKQQGRIYPWNFDEMIDKEKSNEVFIKRMTNKCTYLVGEDVIAKNSLLYSRFMVLNEINNIKIRGKNIEVYLKKEIYNNLFRKNTKVTGKMLLNYLKQYDKDLKYEDLSGFDVDFKANIASYVDFERQIFGERMAEDSVRRMSEDIIRWKTIYGDDNKMLEDIIIKQYGDAIDEKQLKMIRKLRYSGWGRLSEKFLVGIEGVDKETGKSFNIINALWETNNNLMQLLSERFTFKEEIDKVNSEMVYDIKEINYNLIFKDINISPAVKRSVWQTIQITEEIKKVMGGAADKIFVEMARGHQKKAIKTKSRQTHLVELYSSCEKDVREWTEEIKKREEREFNSIKLYLYYKQMGKCMYSGEVIDLDRLMSTNSDWDRDHIYPQSKIKDDSLDNLVLVKKDYNAKKSNGMLSSEIQEQQKDWWKYLLQNNFISKKKYDRLMRREPFSIDELAGFISRQLVETQQSSKVVVDLLKRIYSETSIVTVKASMVSQFRKDDLNMLKSRMVNDYHHAKDAYLNIVVGNVYDAKFTSNYRSWVEENKDKGYSINKIFDYDVKRGSTYVWKGTKENGKEKSEKSGGTIDRIRKTMKKNDILYTEYSYCDKGKLFDETIAKKTKNVKIRLKKNLDTAKYGGYTSANTSYFALVEFDGKNGERVKNIIEVPIYIANMLSHNPDAYLEYCTNIKGLKNVNVLRSCIKKNSLISVDGFLMRIRGANEKNLLFKCGMQPVLSNHEHTIRHIEKYLDKNKDFDVSEKFDKITDQGLINLYDDIIYKLRTVYKERPSNRSDVLEEKRNVFLTLSLEKKVRLVAQIINMIRCDNNTTANLESIGGSKYAGNMAKNKNELSKKELKLINQSVTGLFEDHIKL